MTERPESGRDRGTVVAAVRDALIALWPARFGDVAIDEPVSLGDAGLGLDSVDIVEFLLECEDRLGGPSTEGLLAEGPVTVGRVIDHFAGP